MSLLNYFRKSLLFESEKREIGTLKKSLMVPAQLLKNTNWFLLVFLCFPGGLEQRWTVKKSIEHLRGNRKQYDTKYELSQKLFSLQVSVFINFLEPCQLVCGR